MRHLEILKYWFGTVEETEEYIQSRAKLWFGGAPETDREIKENFENDVLAAANGDLVAWEESPLSCLALIILLDQFSLNIYRGQAKSFQICQQAVPVALKAMDEKYDERFHPLQRVFFYLPFEHAESLSLQRISVEKFRKLEAEVRNPLVRDWIQRTLWYSVEHYKVIDKFGRFPNRNEALGRKFTPEEREYLNAGGSPF